VIWWEPKEDTLPNVTFEDVGEVSKLKKTIEQFLCQDREMNAHKR